MRCWNCKGNHSTVAQVKECHEMGTGGALATQTEEREPVWPPSEGQINYVLGLQEERNLPDGYVVKDKAELAAMDRSDVSDIIVLLRDLSRKEGSAGGSFTMPPGRYAVQDDDNIWRFYQIDKPTEGRWKGYTFIKLLVGSPGSYNKVPMQPATRQRILKIIEGNAKQAMLDFGLQSGVCGRCGSPLTDPQSLERGIGPKCATMSGWF